MLALALLLAAAAAGYFAREALQPRMSRPVADVPVGAPPQASRHSPGFEPPPETAIPDDPFGAMVRQGRDIFVHTDTHAAQYVGNSLRCANCHLDAGRRASSAPMWAAWVSYPKYRSKNRQVNTMADRIAGCFSYSMNGTPPPIDGDIMRALESYFFWLATGAPTGRPPGGHGYPKMPPPKEKPDVARGADVYAARCALCHGAAGAGRRSPDASVVFPPLWGPRSYNGGAGMHRVETAAAFIMHNMPLGLPGTLSDQEAWDVAAYVNSHPRPPDPRAPRIAP